MLIEIRWTERQKRKCALMRKLERKGVRSREDHKKLCLLHY